MVKKFRCKKQFELDEYDEDGLYKETSMSVENDSVWELDEIDTNRIIDGEIRLTLCGQEMVWTWIEINKDTLVEYFEEITQ